MVPIDRRACIAERQADREMGWLWGDLVAQTTRDTHRYSADEYNRLYPWIARIAVLVYSGDQRIRSYQLHPVPPNHAIRRGGWRVLSLGRSRASGCGEPASSPSTSQRSPSGRLLSCRTRSQRPWFDQATILRLLRAGTDRFSQRT